MIDIGKYKDILNGYRFCDLFCGLGGFRLALESFGAKCVFSSDIDPAVSRVYERNFGDNPESDIKTVSAENIPDIDILCAGFPCQAFSISGKQLGFADSRGTLFREIVRIAEVKKPRFMLLENVRNLESHDGGRTFKVIKSEIEGIGYTMHRAVLDSSDYGVPQARKRIYMVCIRDDIDKGYEFPEKIAPKRCVRDVLLPEVPSECFCHFEWTSIDRQNPDFSKPVRVGCCNKSGQGERIYSPDGQGVTLCAEGGGRGAKTGLYLIDGKVRKLAPRECARLQGFPDSYIIVARPNLAKKQFGNSVCVDVLQYILLNLCDGYMGGLNGEK